MIQLPPIHEFANTEDVEDCAQFADKDGQRILVWPITKDKDFFLRVFVATDNYVSYLVGDRADIQEMLVDDFAETEEAYRPVTDESVGLLAAWGLNFSK